MQAGLCEVNKDVRELVVVEKRKSREVDCKTNRKQQKGPEKEKHCALYYTFPHQESLKVMWKWFCPATALSM